VTQISTPAKTKNEDDAPSKDKGTFLGKNELVTVLLSFPLLAPKPPSASHYPPCSGVAPHSAAGEHDPNPYVMGF